MKGRLRFGIAFAASCAVYLIPLASAHWVQMLGAVLWKEMGTDRAPAWKAADVAMASALQAGLFGLVWMLAGRKRWIGLAAGVAAMIPLTIAANALYLVAIPAHFLIQPDHRPEIATLGGQCSVAGYLLDAAPAGVNRWLERGGETWVRREDGSGYGILRSARCEVEPVAVTNVQRVLGNGGVVYASKDGQRFWLLRRGTSQGVELIAPAEVGRYERAPLVSEEGEWVAWIVRGRDRRASLWIERPGGGDRFVFTHELLQRTSLAILQLEMEKREVVISRDLATFVCLRLDGSVAWGPLRPPGIAAQMNTFHIVDGQWVAWDAYVEDRPYRLAWSTGEGSGSEPVRAGSYVVSAAIDDSGQYVAVSTSTALNIGSIRDSVSVLRTRDGAAVFRKFLPAYTRTPVVFPGRGSFAYSSREGAKSIIRVLRLGGP